MVAVVKGPTYLNEVALGSLNPTSPEAQSVSEALDTHCRLILDS